MVNRAIPKIIHYCWFGTNDIPQKVKLCLQSWEKHLPDYKLMLWNEDNFDLKSNLYVQEAYNAKKYAFVSDYVRLYALYNYGGIYMDTDVEVIKSLDTLLTNPAFSGCESNELITSGIIGSQKGHKWISRLLEYYNNRSFLMKDGTYDLTPNTKMITTISSEEFGWEAQNNLQILKDDVYIYPSDYFCPKNWFTKELVLTDNTFVIHHFDGSWLPKGSKVKLNLLRLRNKILKGLIGSKNFEKLKSILIKNKK